MIRIALIIPAIRSKVRIQMGLRYWKHIIEALEKVDFRVTVFTGEDPRSTSEKIVGCGGWQLAVGNNSRGYGWELRLFHPRMILKIAEMKPDIVLSVEYSFASLLGMLAARRCGAKFTIFQEHSSRWVSEMGGLRKLWRKVLLQYTDLVIANTKEARNEIVQLNPACSRKVQIVPLLVPPERKEMMKKKIILPNDAKKPIFSYVGRLIPEKNLISLVRAAALLRREGYGFTVWIVGAGPERESLETAVDEYGLNGIVHLLGVVPYESLGLVYSKSDVFVMPTFADYRSVAVLEAIRFGKPVIDSEKDGNAGVTVIEGINGFIISPYDTNQIAHAMKQFLEFPELVVQMSRESERVAKQVLPTPIESAKQLRRYLQGDWHTA